VGASCFSGVLGASCYTGVLGGSIAALAGADICITVAVDRKDAGVVFLSGVLRNHRSVGLGDSASSIGRQSKRASIILRWVRAVHHQPLQVTTTCRYNCGKPREDLLVVLAIRIYLCIYPVLPPNR
jgi:hypothetical protein